jgi:hypothetical protein
VQTGRALRAGVGENVHRLLVLSLLPVSLATLFLVGYADLAVFSRLVLAPTFGSELQNRVWNFTGNKSSERQACLFHSWTGNPTYVGREIRREAVAANPQVRLVASGYNDVTTLYVSDDALAEAGRGRRLAEYYRLTAPQAARSTESSLRHLERGSILLAQFPLAAGYLVHEADGRLDAELHPIAAKDQHLYETAWPDRTIFTIGRAMHARRAYVVGIVTVDELEQPLYRNEPRAGAS